MHVDMLHTLADWWDNNS